MSWRIRGYVIALGMIVLVLVPITWSGTRDSFPVSSYPMFARKQPTPVVLVRYAVAVLGDDTREFLAPELIANDEVLQAQAVLVRAISQGQRAAQALCERIAARVAEKGGSLVDAREVRVIAGRLDAVAFLTGLDREGDERVHAACPVRRAAGSGEAGAGRETGSAP